MASPNEVHQRFKQLVDECELLALYLNQSTKAKQRRRWLGEMKVILDNMDELIDAERRVETWGQAERFPILLPAARRESHGEQQRDGV